MAGVGEPRRRHTVLATLDDLFIVAALPTETRTRAYHDHLASYAVVAETTIGSGHAA
jgi:hypothetical protein